MRILPKNEFERRWIPETWNAVQKTDRGPVWHWRAEDFWAANRLSAAFIQEMERGSLLS